MVKTAGEAVAMDQASNDQEWLHPVRKLHAEGGLAVPENNQGGYSLCPKLQELLDPEAGSREEEGAYGDNAEARALPDATREVLALLRLSHRMTVPYHQQANGLVERQNKTLAIMLVMYVDESHEDWDEFLGFYDICLQHRATGEYQPHTFHDGVWKGSGDSMGSAGGDWAKPAEARRCRRPNEGDDGA
ncbi:hypothetical protein OUZ56_003188 [Daphnia magna]|uniref:Integrase catalytic domain-containing protein n=1 Tax=Daphnia magna TaxID=35525 RepID=A0ABR0A8A5_9CRUS|nr:hypothetical protein OUZ56_003188 [Daphnia magna]